MMKKVRILLLLILMGFFIVGCSSEEEKTVQLTVLVNGEYYGERIAYVGSKLDFELEDQSYIFLGWYTEDGETSIDGITISETMVINAKAIEYGSKCKINYHFTEGANFKGINYPRNYIVGETTQLVAPYKPYNYEFAGWYYNGKLITEISNTMYGDIDLYDSWIDNNTYYQVTYHDDGATSYSSEKKTTLIAGETYLLPYPIKEGYYFRGWYTDSNFTNRVKTIDETNSENVEVYAKFDEKKAEDTYISFVGDSISTYHGYIPSDAGAYYPSNYNMTAEQTYFLQVVSGMGYQFLKNDSYGGCRLSNDVISGEIVVPCALQDRRIAGLGDENHDPDILICFIGNNDYSQGVSVTAFKENIKKYCDKVRKLYDDVDIYFCLHPKNGYNDSFTPIRNSFNEAIKEMSASEQCNYKVIDLTKCWSDDGYQPYIYAMAHPNAAGFKRIAEVMIETLKETQVYQQD